MVRDLNRFASEHPPLWELDFSWEGFEWIDFSDAERSVISYLRKGTNRTLACVHNFTPEVYRDYRVPLKNVRKIQEVFSTDALEYGGANQRNQDISIESEGFRITVAPLATMIFEVGFE